jgi:hypothetical protein
MRRRPQRQRGDRRAGRESATSPRDIVDFFSGHLDSDLAASGITVDVYKNGCW